MFHDIHAYNLCNAGEITNQHSQHPLDPERVVREFLRLSLSTTKC